MKWISDSIVERTLYVCISEKDTAPILKLDLEDGGIIFFQNVGVHLPRHKALS